MATRLQLQARLEALIGSPNVYFQPPESFKMNYPCIVYDRTSADVKFADDIPYANTMRYEVTVMDTNPDSIIPGKMSLLPKCKLDRHYVVDNLHHDVFTLYY